MNRKIIFIVSLGIIIAFAGWYLFTLQNEVRCVSDKEPPTGNSVWNDRNCIWEMHVGLNVGEEFPAEDEISNDLNKQITEKIVNYTIKLYSRTNSTDDLKHLITYKFDEDLVRYIWVVDLKTEKIVMDYRSYMIGQPSPVLQNSLIPKDVLIADLEDTKQGWIRSKIDGQITTSWIRLHDGLIFGSSFVEKP